VRLIKQLEAIFPGNFAYVMASGILSIAFHIKKFFLFSTLFYLLGAIGYIFLIILYATRLIFYPRLSWSNLLNNKKIFDHFTFVAGTNILALRALLSHQKTLSLTLTFIALAAFVIFFYFFFYLLFFLRKISIKNVNGKWLLIPVAFGSTSLIFIYLFKYGALNSSAWNLLSYSSWSGGILFYFIFITFILFRLFFYPIAAKEMLAPYWICMGAAAINCNAAGELVYSGWGVIFFIHAALILWAIATLFIPLLVLLGIWKHGVLREPFFYSPLLWSIVFPLGMYTMATDVIDTHLPFSLDIFINYLLWTTCIVWIMVSLSYLHSRLR
jgi:tellurite resistance protein TehA-like permease